MLTGYFKYADYTYDIHAYDYGDSVVLYVSSPLVKGKSIVDRGIPYDDGAYDFPSWEQLYAMIGTGSITVDTYAEGTGKDAIKSVINTEFFQTLGSIIRGMKAGCNRNRLDLGDDLFDIGFNPMKNLRYNYNSTNYVITEIETLKELYYENEKGIVLSLTEDGSYAEKIWRNDNTLKTKIKLDLSEFIESVDSTEDWGFDDDNKIFSLQEIIEKNPDKDYLWLKERKYYIVKEMEDVEAICKKIWNHKGKVAFDTETTGLNVNVTSRTGQGDRLVGMVFSVESGTSYYFPVAHKKVKNICNSGNEQFIIEKYFKPILEQKELICHNGSYDWKVMYNYGIFSNIVDDTYILFKVTLWNTQRSLGLSLKNLVKVFLHRDSFELKDFVRGRFGDSVRFWDLEEESVKYYACPDTDSLLDLYNFCMEKNFLAEYDAKKIYEIEVAFSLVIAYQEYYGHCVDIDRIDDLKEAIVRDKETCYKTMVDIVGYDFNPKSSPDMQKVCFTTLKLPEIEKTDAGNPSTGKETRKKWLKSNIPDTQKTFIKNLNKYLDARTLESNFTKNIDKFATKDGLMFSEVQQFLETGRVSTKNPNYQGYSDTVKKYIVPRTGFYSIDADYSTVEARIMVSMAGCSGMVSKLHDPDTDYHRQKASDMFSVPYELVTDALRKMSKGVNFGILYGLGDPNLGVNLYGFKSAENTRKAKQQKKLYFKGMEELEGFIDYSKSQGTNDHFSTTFFKRRRYFDPRRVRKDTIERQACNARIQGTAADLYKLAMVRFLHTIRKNGWLGKVLISAFVHDECFVEAHKSIDPMVCLKALRTAMMIDIDGWCPLFTGMGFGRDWYEAKHTEIPVQVQEYFSNEFGESGLDWWNGDTKKLCEYVVASISNYKRDRVLNYLKDINNWGKVFKPVENELAHELMYDIKDGLQVEGCIDNNCEVKTDMIENLEEFCRIFDCLDLFKKANIQKPVEQKTNVSTSVSTEELLTEEEVDPKDVMLARLKMMGVFMSTSASGRKLYFLYDEKQTVLMNLIHKEVTKLQGNVEVIAVKSDGSEYTTGIYTDARSYPVVLQLYLKYKNLASVRR